MGDWYCWVCSVKIFGPLARAVHHGQNFHIVTQSIGDDVSDIGQDKFTRALNPAVPSDFRCLRQVPGPVENAVDQLDAAAGFRSAI